MPDAAPLVGTTWQAVELDGRPLPAGVHPTLELTEDGRVAGSGGVNRIIGGYHLGDGVIDFGQLATTLMAGPTEAMAVERRVLSLLQGRRPYRLEGARLRIGSSGSELCYEAVAAEAPGSESPGSQSAGSTVTGSLVGADGAEVPPDATVTVQLLDVSLADAPSKTVAEQVIENPTPGSLSFALPYDPGAVDPRASYAVSARVTRGDDLLFVSDTHNPVLTRGASDRVDVRLRAVAPPPPS